MGRAAIIASMLAVSVAGCGLPGAVVAGSVTAGPMCPTAQCEPLAAPGINVRLTGPNGNLDAVTDGAGRFSVIVPSGSYAVALSGTLPNNRYVTGTFADFGGPKRITVGPGSWVTLRFVLDSGIR